ncbi:HIT domain-containing protein [Sphingomonas sanguinis]|uniref:HIT domain-containing protein n=1 Tax=Sphingomonas sanguinis TaxID=33051 RepID=A0ABU5LTZ8_9SPHN|nr:HIT domain-containing protein [Sphingomonas sanguinis]MDZ7283404.1 HIT domain-containing protein [Sphingomonas sanguinis]
MRHSSISRFSALIVALATGLSGGSATVADAQIATPPCPLSASYRTDNPFARIIRGEIPASIIAQDRRVMAIIPLDWEHPGHALVIPKAPVRNLDDLSDRDALAVLHMVKRIAVAQQRALGSTGYSLQQNNASRQDVCHFHVHVIPDTPSVPRTRHTRSEMDAMAERLRAALPPR